MAQPVSPKRSATFDAIVDTVLPPVAGDGPAWTSSAEGQSLHGRLGWLLERLPHDTDRKKLLQFLALFGSPVGALTLYGRPRPFLSMSDESRAEAIRRMQRHPFGLIRGGARSLKTLAALLWLTTEDMARRPVAWDAIGYPGPDGPPPPTPKPLPTVQVAADTEISCDVVIVGSGAGGGTAAGILAGAGLDVVVLEAGGYANEADFTHLEADAYRRMYLHGALAATADGGMALLSGATLGGGTVINYTTSFATPPDVRAEWDRVAGFEGVFTGEAYQDSLEAVADRLGVNSDHGLPSSRALIMEDGLRRLGWHVAEMPRNVRGCRVGQCGFCTMGCRLGAKRSTLRTYLEDAAASGARIVTGASVEQVLTEEGSAVGVIAAVGEATLRVRSRAVVLAAGALNTPAILLRSGLGTKAVGRYLRTHPVTAVWGRFQDRVEPWSGTMQARYSDQFADIEAGYGFKLETAPVHPLFPSVFLGWQDGASFKRDILGLAHLSVIGVLLRDRDHGRVVIRRDGSPVWKYRLSAYDRDHVRAGVAAAAEVLAAAGAEEVISSTARPVRWRPGETDSPAGFASEVDVIGYGSNQTTYLSFHQMGSARMGADPADSVVDGDNAVHGCRGLYVMDGSCFPTASGVNPMISIAAIAHRGAERLAGRIG